MASDPSTIYIYSNDGSDLLLSWAEILGEVRYLVNTTVGDLQQSDLPCIAIYGYSTANTWGKALDMSSYAGLSTTVNATAPDQALKDTALNSTTKFYYAVPFHAISKINISGVKYAVKDGEARASISAIRGNYVTTDTAQTISGGKTFDANVTLNNNICINGKISSTTRNLLKLNSSGAVILGDNSSELICYTSGNMRPSGNGTKTLGSSSYKWKDLYLSGSLKDGTNSITVAQIAAKQDALPTVVNDRYLHTNSSTGDLEWGTALPLTGGHISTSGTDSTGTTNGWDILPGYITRTASTYDPSTPGNPWIHLRSANSYGYHFEALPSSLKIWYDSSYDDAATITPTSITLAHTVYATNGIIFEQGSYKKIVDNAERGSVYFPAIPAETTDTLALQSQIQNVEIVDLTSL